MSNNPFTGRIEELRRSGEEAVSPPPRRKRKSTKNSEDQLIGCPMWWLQHILPAVNTKISSLSPSTCGGGGSFAETATNSTCQMVNSRP